MLKFVSLLGVFLGLAACVSRAPFREERDGAELKTAERILIGEVEYQNFTMRDLVGKGQMEAEVYGDYRLPEGFIPNADYNKATRVLASNAMPLMGGALGVLIYSFKMATTAAKEELTFDVRKGQRLDAGEVPANGGGFRILADRTKPFYFYGVHGVGSAPIAVKKANLAFPLIVEPSEDPCVYIGSIIFEKTSKGITARLENRYERLKQDLTSFVVGCEAKPLLAEPVGKS